MVRSPHLPSFLLTFIFCSFSLILKMKVTQKYIHWLLSSLLFFISMMTFLLFPVLPWSSVSHPEHPFHDYSSLFFSHLSLPLMPSVRPLTARITTPRRPLSVGRQAEVSCVSSGSRPPAIITWWLGSKQLTQVSDDMTRHLNLTTSTVHFKPSAIDHGKVLSCRADHSILPDSALEDSWLLDVYCKHFSYNDNHNNTFVSCTVSSLF